MSTASALSQLLRGSGAKARQIDASTWRIVRARKAAPPPSPTPAAAVQLAPVAQEPPADIIVPASTRDIPLPRYAGMGETVTGGLSETADAAQGTAALLSRGASLSSTHAGAGRNKLCNRAIADSGVAGQLSLDRPLRAALCAPARSPRGVRSCWGLASMLSLLIPYPTPPVKLRYV